jgi:hypothetical protein
MDYGTPWDPMPVQAPLPSALPSPPKRLGRRPATIPTAWVAAEVPWLYHHLTISGLADGVTAFAEAARGADIFNLAASQPKPIRSLTIEGCRILARQFRDRVEERAAQAAGRVGRSHACPFDLHTLLPVPARILDLGASHPEARAWLSQHWGLTESPRQVAERPGAKGGRRLPGGHSVVGYSFFTAHETPHAAVAKLGQRWPTLRFLLQPRSLD